MAIHVKELVIKANVGLDRGSEGSVKTGSPEAGVNTETLVNAAVAEVMRLMKDKKNR